MRTIKDLILPVDLPVIIGQGFNSGKSHCLVESDGNLFDESYALDFLLEEGSNVYAAKDGIVQSVNITHDFNYFPQNGQEDPELKQKALDSINLIIILHDNKIVSVYQHLRKNGAAVKFNDEVKEGQLIGYSGNTGYSSAPHLHFNLYDLNPREGFTLSTLPFTFRNYDEPLEDREINHELH